MHTRFALDSAMLTAPRLTIVTMALACLAGPAAARAQDASPWDKQPHAQARLIAGSVMKSADATYLHAGVEIRLDAGWKTYWREPGDSGVPPTFDFSGSENVKSVAVEWPAPERFPDGAGGNSIGYVGRLVLPLRIVQKDAGKHASVHLKLNYAVCGNLCVPAEATLELAITYAHSGRRLGDLGAAPQPPGYRLRNGDLALERLDELGDTRGDRSARSEPAQTPKGAKGVSSSNNGTTREGTYAE